MTSRYNIFRKSGGDFLVHLRNMTISEFDVFKIDTISEYAKEQIAAGEWDLAGSDEKSRLVFEKMLPRGLATPNHYLWSIVNTELDTVIGTVWIQNRHRGEKRTAHVLNIVIFRPYRRMGYARQAMLLVEDRMRSQGADELTLHVFGHNESALNLYRSLDFKIIEISMAKALKKPLDSDNSSI